MKEKMVVRSHDVNIDKEYAQWYSFYTTPSAIDKLQQIAQEIPEIKLARAVREMPDEKLKRPVAEF